jgi:riboflavin synthase
MFTGIIEGLGEVVKIDSEGSNLNFSICSNISSELKIDQSVSHNGVCLTVVELFDSGHVVTAIDETLSKSNLSQLKVGDMVNLERSMLADGRFDGHIVQGHVDQVGKCTGITESEGSWLYRFEYDSISTGGNITVEKGSICVNGTSLTCFESKIDGFTVAIIPYTFQNTNFKELKIGDIVNLEFDVIGKYVQKVLGAQRN